MEQYIRIQQIADNISEHPFLRDVSYERIINYAFELIRKVGCPKLYEDKVAQVKIHNYRGELPCDFVEILSVMGCDGKEYVTTMDMFFTGQHCKPKPCGPGSITVETKQIVKGCGSYLEKKVTAYAPTEESKPSAVGTYKIQGNIIFTDIPETTIKVAYRALHLDENGFPMLPNNQAFISAVEAYIKVKRFEILFDQGKISPAVYQNAQQEYAWAVGQASNDLIMPTIDEMETLSHVWNTLIPRVSEHRDGFATAHRREYLIRH